MHSSNFSSRCTEYLFLLYRISVPDVPLRVFPMYRGNVPVIPSPFAKCVPDVPNLVEWI